MFKSVAGFFREIGRRLGFLKPVAEEYFHRILRVMEEAYQAVLMLTEELPDWAVEAVRKEYPNAFQDANSEEERKMYLTVAAQVILQRVFPFLTTTQARIAVLAAYGVYKALKKQ